MADPVWKLSVDLEAKTATFKSGMADAAKSARTSFTDIKSGAGEMGGHVTTNMFASRHAVMAVSEAFGDTMPRAITALLVHIGPLGAALEAAFPFAAIGLAAVLLAEHFQKLREEGVKLTLDQERFATASNSAFNALDQKLLQAGIKSDELRNDHLGALRKELELIDKQSMAELVHSFGEISKATDAVFEDLKSHWYTFGIGSSGAKNALDEFKAKYENLLSKGDKQGASDLLAGTLASANKVLHAQDEIKRKGLSGTGTGTDEAWAAQMEHARLANVLKQAGVGLTEAEIKAQQALVGLLESQKTVEQKVGDIRSKDVANATRGTAGQYASEQAAAAKAAAESMARIRETELQAGRAMANAQLAIQRGSLDDREAVDVAFADKEYKIQLAGNAAQIAALDRLSKDYPNALKGLHEKAEELTATHNARIVEINARALTEQAAKDLTDIEQGEREKIEATRQGSAERIAAIETALARERGLQLQDTNFYRELLTQKVENERRAAEETAKLVAEGGRIAADHEIKMGELSLAAEAQQIALRNSMHRVAAQQRVQQEIQLASQETALKMTGVSQQIAALDKGGRDYQNKLAELQNKQKQLIREHENEVTGIRVRAEIERNTRILSAEDQFNTTVSSGMAHMLMGHQSFASTMTSLGNEIVSGMMQNAIKSILANDMTKESDAAAAARKAFNAGMHFPWPTNLVMAPVLGAAAFASVMAFQEGTDSVPGIGRGDRVPAMLEPGEGVVPGGVMDGLRAMARSGSMGGGNHYHAHTRITINASALDTGGMDTVLDRHSDKIQKHVENTMRKMNR